MTPEERRQLVRRARFGRKEPLTTAGGIAVCSHPLASRAAVDVLRAGGNACDAALAASLAQTVVEPHMTTITGMLSMLHHDAATGRTEYCNGAMNAPLAPLPGFSAADIAGGRAVATPGFWPAVEATSRRWGSLPLEVVAAAAMEHARNGFEVHQFLYGEAFMHASRLGSTAGGREIFFPGGSLVEPGGLLVQHRAADTLERLVEGGMDEYLGFFAEEVCRVTAEAGGVLTRADFEAYEVRWDEPARGSYRGTELVGSPPPDTGGTHVIEALHVLEHLDLAAMGRPQESAETLWWLLAVHDEVLRAGTRMNDPATHPLPLDVILSKEHAMARLALVGMGAPAGGPAPVAPPGSNQVTVVDAQGNAATVLHSCMSTPWSNGLFAAGVSVCAAGTHFLRTMPLPGRRATCIVVPSMALRDGVPVIVAGSPSMSLIANLVQNYVNLLDFGDSLATSVHRPRFGHGDEGGGQLVEADFPEEVLAGVERRGMRLGRVNPWYWLNGSYEAVVVDPVTGLRTACGDPRRTSSPDATDAA